jgi:hypothetical protein
LPKQDNLTESELIPQKGERALIVGQTGTGKTFLVIWLLERMAGSPFVIYDTKSEDKFTKLPSSAVVTSWSQVLDAIDDHELDYIIFRPPVSDIAEPKILDGYLQRHYDDLPDVAAYVDEIYTFHNGGRAGPGLLALLTRGRSRGISTIISTQRPAWLSNFALTEAQKFYVLNLIDKKDKKRLGDVIPDFADAPRLDPYHFYFYLSGSEKYLLMKPVKADKKFITGYVDEIVKVAADAPKAKSSNWI